MDTERFELELIRQEQTARKASDEHLLDCLRVAGLGDPATALGEVSMTAHFFLTAWATFDRLKAEGQFSRRPFHAPRFLAAYHTPLAERREDYQLGLAISLTIDLNYYERDAVWEPAARRAATETADEQSWCNFFDAMTHPTITEPAPIPAKRGRNHMGPVDITKPTLSEAEAATVLGFSRRWLSQKRTEKKSKIPARLYRQHGSGGNIVYVTKFLLQWLEEPGNELFNPGKRRKRE